MTAPSRSPDQPTGKLSHSQPGWFLLVVGVIYPSAVLALELATRMCAGTFFDPMPTVWHTLLVAAVPVSNLLVWLRCRQHLRTFMSRSRSTTDQSAIHRTVPEHIGHRGDQREITCSYEPACPRFK